MDNIEKILSSLERPKSFSQLKEDTGLENGVLQHHINNSKKIVKKNGAIMLEDQCPNCGLKEICNDKCLHKTLQNDRKRRITKLIDEGFSQADIAQKLDISRPTVNYHIEDLRDKNIINGEKVRDRAKEIL